MRIVIRTIPRQTRRCRKTAAVTIAVVAAAVATGAGSSSLAGRVRLTVSGAGKLVDAPLGLRVEGFAPEERVTVRIDARDARGTQWRSQATFAADAHGVVDPARQAPLGGSYRGVRSEGLFWSMRPVEPPQDDVAFLVPHRGISLEIGVSARSRHVTGGVVRRLVQGRGVERRPLLLATTGVVGRYYAPAPQRAQRPGVLLIGGSEGGIGGELVANLLASHGYPALSVAYFGVPGLPRRLSEIPLEYFVRALRWLARQPGVGENRLIVFGASRGSEAALLLAVHFPTLVRAVIAISPSNVSVGSYPGCDGPAWTLGGRPIAYQCTFGPNENTTGAAIPVGRIRARMLLVCGGADAVWPSCPMARAIERQRGTARDVLLAFPHAGHGVGFVPNIPIWFDHLSGDSLQANPTARERFWPRMLRFVRTAPA